MDEDYVGYARRVDWPEDDRTAHEKYLDNQRELREQGFTAYNCDYVDEFPRYG